MNDKELERKKRRLEGQYRCHRNNMHHLDKVLQKNGHIEMSMGGTGYDEGNNYIGDFDIELDRENWQHFAPFLGIGLNGTIQELRKALKALGVDTVKIDNELEAEWKAADAEDNTCSECGCDPCECDEDYCPFCDSSPCSCNEQDAEDVVSDSL